MNIGRSIKLAQAYNDISNTELAEISGLGTSHLSNLKSKVSCSGNILEKLSEAFNMSVSEFIALGE